MCRMMLPCPHNMCANAAGDVNAAVVSSTSIVGSAVPFFPAGCTVQLAVSPQLLSQCQAMRSVMTLWQQSTSCSLACLLASSSFSFMNAFIHAFIFHASFHSLIHSLVDVLAVTYGKQGCLQIIVWNIICGSLFLSGQTWDCAFVKFQSKLMFCC